jgi:transcriptional regulator with XRE-family HTH domain
MDISKNIKAIREERKISQSEIARRLGVEPTNYPRMEKRGDKLTVEQLGRIAGALGVSVVELLTGEPKSGQDSERVKELIQQNEQLLREQGEFWLKAILLIHSAITDKGLEMGLLKEGEEVKGILSYLIEVFGANARFIEARTLNLSILDMFPPDKVNLILDELFKIQWFRTLASHLPFDKKVHTFYKNWFLKNEDFLIKTVGERMF